MTTHKSLKRAVRARMAKTGERYATARRALVGETAGGATPTRTGGLHPETWTLTRALADAGFVSARTGEPLSEAMILGIGGGLGAGYILWEFKTMGAILTLGFQNRWQYPGIPGWAGTTLERLGVDADLHETGGARGARDTLDRALDEGASVIASIDLQSIGFWGQPGELAGNCGGQVLVSGRRDAETYLIDDRGEAPLHVPAATLAAARARIGSFKHRLIRVRPRDATLADDRLRAAIVAGLEHQVEHLGSPSDSFSLPAWRKWSRMVTDRSAAKGWPRVFPDGSGLFGALISLVEGVDGDVGASGGNLRHLYATFLDEAAEIVDLPGLAGAATAWRAAGDLWDDFADAAVPPGLTDGIEAIDAAERVHDAVMRGETGRADAAAAAVTLWELRARHADAMPLPPDAVDGLLEDLAARLATIFEAERAALATTAIGLGR